MKSSENVTEGIKLDPKALTEEKKVKFDDDEQRRVEIDYDKKFLSDNNIFHSGLDSATERKIRNKKNFNRSQTF